MSIDFHDEKNKLTYTGRTADGSWREMIMSLADPSDKTVMDLGCGGGIYCKAWAELGAKQVIGVDFSHVMLQAAADNCSGLGNVHFHQGDATQTGWASQSVDILFARALIHHLPDTRPFFAEAFRLLKPGGVIIIQDRTLEDVKIPGSPEHIRGYFFERFPRLLKVEEKRRPDSSLLIRQAEEEGFQAVQLHRLWETRKIYASAAGLLAELRSRKGRSILHELTDEEIDALIRHVQSQLQEDTVVTEKDRWTLLTARRC